MHSEVLAVVRCPTVYLSVTLVYCFKMAKEVSWVKIASNFFLGLVAISEIGIGMISFRESS